MRGYLRALGPGLVTGASDDDPSGIATYAQAGASFGFGFLWTALLTFPLMAAVQEICDRTALATGKGLGELATERPGRDRSHTGQPSVRSATWRVSPGERACSGPFSILLMQNATVSVAYMARG